MIRFSDRDILSQLTQKAIANDFCSPSEIPVPKKSAELKLFPLSDIPGAERVLIRETENWIVVPAFHPLCKGHLSFLSRKDLKPLLYQPLILREQFKDILWEMVFYLQAYYKPTVCLFEEVKTSPYGDGLQSTIDLLPAKSDFYCAVRFLYDDWQEIETKEELGNIEGAYWLLTLFDDGKETTIFRKTNKDCPVQFFKKLFSWVQETYAKSQEYGSE